MRLPPFAGERMAELPRFTDLRAIAEEIGDQPEYRRIRTAIDRAGRAQSCVSDLAEAETCLDALADIQGSVRRQDTITRLATEAALLRTAVTLYERATDAAAKLGQRGSISIIEQLTVEQRADHEALVLLRNRSLAHVYAGEEVDGQVWHEELLFAVEVGVPWQPAAASHRIQFSASTLARLKRQVPIALHLIRERFLLRLSELSEILRINPLPIAMLERHLFDPIARFGSERAARNVLAAREEGRGSFIG